MKGRLGPARHCGPKVDGANEFYRKLGVQAEVCELPIVRILQDRARRIIGLTQAGEPSVQNACRSARRVPLLEVR
jgi:hypothetical protein